MKGNATNGNAVSEISGAELALVSGGQYTAIQPWAIGTSGAFQAMMVQKLEILGNPIGPNGH
jgi:hypothetical protein